MVLDREWYNIRDHRCKKNNLKCLCGFIGKNWNEMEMHFNKMADISIAEYRGSENK